MALINDPTGKPISGRNIRIGFPEISVAPFITPTPIDPTDDAGWRRLGMLAPGSVVPEAGKEIFGVKSGIPETDKKRFLVGMTGMIDFVLQEFTPFAHQLSVGTELTFTSTAAGAPLGTVGVTTVALVAPNVGSKKHIAVSNADAALISAALGAGRVTLEIPQGSAILYGTWNVYLGVGAVGAADSNGVGNTLISLDGEADEVVATGATVKRITGWKQIVGGNDLGEYQLRAKFSMTDGTTLVKHYKKGNFTAPNKVDMPEKQNMRMPMKFEAIGQSEVISGVERLVLIEDYFLGL